MAQNWAVGKNGKVTFSGTDLCVTGWTLNESGDDADTTNTCGSGVKTSKIINTEYTGTFDSQWDLDAHPTTTPNITRGQTGTALLYVSTTEYISVAIEIKTFDITSTVSDTIRFSCSFQATAAPVYPT
jgi:hypothetical protein